jgi:hypothetical protein
MRPPWLLKQRSSSRGRAGGERASAAKRVGGAVLSGATYPFTYRSELPSVAGDSTRPLTFRRHDADAIEAELYSHLVPIKRRIWLQRAVLLFIRGAVLVAGVFAIASFLDLARFPVPQAILGVAAVFVSLLSLVLILQQRVSYFDAARVLDRRLGLHQVIGTAVELTGQNADGRLARLQMRRATDALRRLESRDAIRIGLPMRDLRAFAALAVMALLFTYVAALNLTWPGTPPAEDLASDPGADITSEVPYDQSYYEGDGGSTLDPELFNNSLDDYRADLENQNLSPEEVQQRMAEIQAAMAQRAEQLNKQRQALADLADALSDSSTTSDAADSIRRGDFQKASQQLAELGKQSQQLSARARQDLARRLAEAAKKVQPNNQELANRMAKAAQQLSSSDAKASEQALGELGEGVQQAGDQMKQLQDASGNYDPSMMDQDAAGGASDLSAEDLSALQNFEGGAGEQGQGAEGDMGEMGEGFDGAGLGADGQSGASGQPGSGQRSDQLGEEASAGAGAGGGKSNVEQYRAQSADKNSQGKVLELRGRPNPAAGDGVLDDSGKVPLVASNDGSVGGASGSGGRSVIVDPLTVRGEQNFVPWEKRQIVKDFFTGASK